MSMGIFYIHKGIGCGVYFSNYQAKLPIKIKPSEASELVIWGRRKHEQGRLPFGGCVNFSEINSEEWSAWFPRVVIVPASCFVEQDIEGQSKCFNLTEGKWIQALLVKINTERRAYIVTIKPNTKKRIFERWPRILSKQTDFNVKNQSQALY